MVVIDKHHDILFLGILNITNPEAKNFAPSIPSEFKKKQNHISGELFLEDFGKYFVCL